HVHFEEPFPKIRAHGLIITDGAKMSKSRGNVVIPDSYIQRWGADTFRMYLMFLGPFQEGGDFRETGIVGIRRFLDKVWASAHEAAGLTPGASPGLPSEVARKLHQTIQRVTADTEGLDYNTAIAAMMEYVNLLREQGVASRAAVEPLLIMLASYAPHLAEELWAALGHAPSGENAARGADREVGKHRNREGGPGGRVPAEHEERRHGDERADRRRRAGQPPLLERRRVGFTDFQLFPHLLIEGALRVAHHFGRHLARDAGLDALRLIHERELFLLYVGHDADLFLLHRDLVVVHFLLALRREVARGAHGQRVGEHPRDPRDQQDVRRDIGPDHARHQPEIRRQAVVEAVNHVAQEPPRPRLVPGFRGPTGETRQRLGMCRRLLGELER